MDEKKEAKGLEKGQRRLDDDDDDDDQDDDDDDGPSDPDDVLNKIKSGKSKAKAAKDTAAKLPKKMKSKDDEGPIHQNEWYRVILDEAHTIKNRNAMKSKACHALRSEYRCTFSALALRFGSASRCRF